MTTRRSVVGALGVVVVIAIAVGAYQAGERRTEPSATTGHDPLHDCTGTQQELNTCAAEELEQVGAALDAVLADVRSFVSTARQRALDDSQQQWISYRDTLCEAHALEDGSIQTLNVLTCRIDLTHQRAVDVCTWALPNAELDAVVAPPETCRGLRS